MELLRVSTKSHKVLVAPISDLQWSGAQGPTAVTIAQRHIARVLGYEKEGWTVRFVGLGDYIDFLSPSNRQRLASAALYDSADQVIDEKAHQLVEEVFNTILKPTRGKWLGILEGHHFYEAQGSTSDMWLAEILECSFLGTETYIRLEPSGIVLWAHHGVGGGQLPSAPINKLYHVAHGLVGADVYMMGHTTKMGVVRLSRPTPDWNRTKPDLTHSDIYLVSVGGFSKSTIVGHKQGRIVRGDYAEQKMLTPSPLAAPLVWVDGKGTPKVRVEV